MLWGERARAELKRISGRAAASGELTPAEERVAALVALGRTNKEVAAALFLFRSHGRGTSRPLSSGNSESADAPRSRGRFKYAGSHRQRRGMCPLPSSRPRRSLASGGHEATTSGGEAPMTRTISLIIATVGTALLLAVPAFADDWASDQRSEAVGVRQPRQRRSRSRAWAGAVRPNARRARGVPDGEARRAARVSAVSQTSSGRSSRRPWPRRARGGPSIFCRSLSASASAFCW